MGNVTRNPMRDSDYIVGKKNARGGQTYYLREQRDELKELARELQVAAKKALDYIGCPDARDDAGNAAKQALREVLDKSVESVTKEKPV